MTGGEQARTAGGIANGDGRQEPMVGVAGAFSEEAREELPIQVETTGTKEFPFAACQLCPGKLGQDLCS